MDSPKAQRSSREDGEGKGVLFVQSFHLEPPLPRPSFHPLCRHLKSAWVLHARKK